MADSLDKLNAFIDAKLTDEKIGIEAIALVGFSQGTMMSLHLAPRRDTAMAGVVGGVEIYLPLKGLIDVEKETARLTKEREKLQKEIKRLTGKLSNEGFLKKAPAAVVAGEREKLAGYEEKEKSLEARLADLAKL